MNLEIGTTYYRLTFADPKQTMPGLKPMVYVGLNIFSEPGEENTYYFQDTVSACRYGLLGEGENVVVYSFKPKELGVDIITLAEAVTAIDQAYKNYIAAGEPKLVKV